MSTRGMGRVLLPAVLLAMQACWLYVWTSLIETELLDARSISITIILFLPAGAIAFTHLRTLPLHHVTRLVCYVVLWMILAMLAGKIVLYPTMSWSQPDWILALPAALGSLIYETRPAELLLLLGSGFAWYLGSRAARRSLDHSTLLGEFQFGLLLLIAAFLAAQALDAPTGHHVPLALAFFALSLAGVAITRNREDDTGASLLARRHFTGPLAGLLVTVSILGLVASIAVTPTLLNAVLDALRYIGHLVGAAFSFLASLIPESEFAPIEEPPPAAGDDSELREFYRGIPWPATLRRILFIAWTVVVIGTVLFALWMICSQILDWLKRRSDTRGVEVESLDSGLLADLLAFLLWLRDGIRRLSHRAGQHFLRRVSSGSDESWLTLYTTLTRWAGKRLQTRDASQSAHEYQALLARLHPVAAPDIAMVTDIYARARYGGHEPDLETVNEMSQALRRIRRAPRSANAARSDTTTEGE